MRLSCHRPGFKFDPKKENIFQLQQVQWPWTCTEDCTTFIFAENLDTIRGSQFSESSIFFQKENQYHQSHTDTMLMQLTVSMYNIPCLSSKVFMQLFVGLIGY